MSQLVDYITPGVMVSQLWPNSRETEGETLNAMKSVLKFGFYKAFQTVEIPYSDERKAIAELIEQSEATLTYCVSRVLNENKLNLSSLDAAVRRKSCEKVIACMNEAVESGANSISFISGPAPSDASVRKKALTCLTESLTTICKEAKAYSNLKVVIEPMDYFAHKKNTLGSIQESVEICTELKERELDLYLCLDTAHTLLNGEEPVEALKLALPFVDEFHFCNCVTDRSHSLFGDHHIPFGLPGILDEKKITEIMQESLNIGFYHHSVKPLVFCEVLNRTEEDQAILLSSYKNLLQHAWLKIDPSF